MPRSLLSWVIWTLEASGCLSRTSLFSTTWPGTSRVAPFPTWVQPQRVGCTSEPVGRWRDQTEIPWQGVDNRTPSSWSSRGHTPNWPGYQAELSRQPHGASWSAEQTQGTSEGPWGRFRWHPGTTYTAQPGVPALTCCPGMYTHSYSWTLPTLPPAQTTTTTSVLPFPTL